MTGTGRPCVAGDFAGSWTLERHIEDALGPPARFTGTARWTAEGDGFVQVETGTLQIEGQGRFTAERRYRWGADLAVFFDDGRFFHQVPARGGRADHWCDPDRYVVDYEFLLSANALAEFHTTWQVDGPRKSYRMVSAYRRLADGPGADMADSAGAKSCLR
ncbi:DUF6314 family protein [Marinibacterium sp. SX1]|uniref:DUF6314 family protein n=1 Tax=Marinibacterium sp. SX1 TaxID=3388424 RepID=UPI003D16EA94